MPTYRKLHTKIIDSYDFAEMPDDFTRVFWMLLIVVADSEGRAIDNPAWLRSRMFPLRDDVKTAHIEGALSWLAGRGMIFRYEVEGRKYFYVAKFKDYQSNTEREAKSVLPVPPATQELLMSNSEVNQELPRPAAGAGVFVNASEYVNIFTLYQNEIGNITPVMADEIKLTETEYPNTWIVEAIHEAAKNNARSWKYVYAILKRWKAQGRKELPPREPTDTGPVEIILPGGQVVEAKR